MNQREIYNLWIKFYPFMTDDYISEIQRYQAGNVSYRALGREFGYCHHTISRIINGK